MATYRNRNFFDSSICYGLATISMLIFYFQRMEIMEQYVAGGVSAAISQRDSPKQKVKIKNYNSKESSQLTTQNKKSQFNCDSKEKSHVKYKIASCSTEKIHKKMNELKENKTKIPYPFKQTIHLNSNKNSESRRGRKRKFELNETGDGKKEAGKTEGVNTIKSKNSKLMGDNQSKKDSYDIRETTDIISSNNLQRENKQMEKLAKSEENQNSAKKDDRTIYVGNLPLKYDHKKVVKLFSKFGKIENARIRCVPIPSFGFPKRKAAITKKFNANRKSVSAYVVFKSEESVSKAVELNGMVIEEHHIRIDKAVPQKKDLKKSVFVGGLPFDIEDDELWDFFKDCGEIDSVRIVRDDKFSMGKGFGYVNFKSSASVELALALDSHEIKNRKINVQRCISKKKKDFKKSLSLKKGKKSRKQRHHKNFSSKSDKNSSKHDFQGKEAEHKQKRKKRKLTKDVARKNRILSTLKLSLKKNKNGNNKSNN